MRWTTETSTPASLATLRMPLPFPGAITQPRPGRPLKAQTLGGPQESSAPGNPHSPRGTQESPWATLGALASMSGDGDEGWLPRRGQRHPSYHARETRKLSDGWLRRAVSSGGDRPLTDRPNTNNSGRPLPTFLKRPSWVPRSGSDEEGTRVTLGNLRPARVRCRHWF